MYTDSEIVSTNSEIVLYTVRLCPMITRLRLMIVDCSSWLWYYILKQWDCVHNSENVSYNSETFCPDSDIVLFNSEIVLTNGKITSYDLDNESYDNKILSDHSELLYSASWFLSTNYDFVFKDTVIVL